MATNKNTATISIPELKITIADKLWTAKNVNGSLIISDDHNQHKANFARICNVTGKSGAKLSTVMSEDDIGDILRDIYERRSQFNMNRAIGQLDF